MAAAGILGPNLVEAFSGTFHDLKLWQYRQILYASKIQGKFKHCPAVAVEINCSSLSAPVNFSCILRLPRLVNKLGSISKCQMESFVYFWLSSETGVVGRAAFLRLIIYQGMQISL